MNNKTEPFRFARWIGSIFSATAAASAKKAQAERNMPVAATVLYPHLSRPSARRDVWCDGALDRSRSRRAV